MTTRAAVPLFVSIVSMIALCGFGALVWINFGWALAVALCGLVVFVSAGYAAVSTRRSWLRFRRRRTALFVTLGAGLVVAVIASQLTYRVPFSPETPAAGGTDAYAALMQLEVRGRAPASGYDCVGQFGPAWFDVDGNGCDTRNDVLARDLTEVRASWCWVFEGALDDPFTGQRVWFERGASTSALVQIDHVVPMMDAWQKGAQNLSFEQRREFANDPLNLLAVDGLTNQSKGHGDAATWLPPNKEFRCDYVATQIAVKAKHGLWVTKAERGAMMRVLSGCPAQTLPQG